MVDNPVQEDECSATFVVHVTRKAGEPWKGNVSWVTERCRQQFGSMQELFELMDSTLSYETSEQAGKSGRINNEK